MPINPPGRYRGDIDVRRSLQANQRHLRRTSRAPIFYGDTLMEAVLALDDDGGIDFFIEGKYPSKVINYNDGGGNFNLLNHTYYDGAHKFLTSGVDATRVNIQAENGGAVQFYIADGAGAIAGDPIGAWAASYLFDKDGVDLGPGLKVSLKFQNQIKAKWAGPVDETWAYMDANDDFFIANQEQLNRLEIYDGTGGVRLHYDPNVDNHQFIVDDSGIHGYIGGIQRMLFSPGGDIFLKDASASNIIQWDESLATLNVRTKTIDLTEDFTVVKFSGTTGPLGFEVVGGESALYYRTTPNAWSFENSGGAKRLEIDVDTAPYVFINGNEVWHAGNDGSGSGLNADMVDGSHASAFATSGHGHSQYVEVGSSTAFSPNTWLNSSQKTVHVSTSKAKHKKSIREWHISDEMWERVTTHEWESKLPLDEGGTFRGFVWDYLPEELRDEQTPNLVALLAAAVDRIKQLEGRVAELERVIGTNPPT